jgi:hypothetical protein
LPPDLFTPPPTRPTWDSLPALLARRVTDLLADLLRAVRGQQPPSARRKGAADE